MVPGQKANIANSEKSIDLPHSNYMLSVLIRIASIIMSAHNIQFHNEIRKGP